MAPGQPVHPMRWLTSRLQRKFILILASILLVTSAAFLLMVVALYRGQLVKEHARASLQVNHLLQASLENAMLKRDIAGLRDIVDRLGKQKDVAGVMILNPRFEVRFSTDRNRLLTRFVNPDIRAAMASKTPRTSFVPAPAGTELLRSINPVPNQEICSECHGSPATNPVNGLLIVDYVATGIRMDARKSAIMLASIGFAVVLATGLAVWIGLHHLVVARIRSLQESSRLLTKGALDTRTGMTGNDEIAQLGSSIDTMATQLGQTLDDLNSAGRFLQNVIDSIPDGVRVIDDDFNIIKANEAYCRHVGQTMDAVIGVKCYHSSHQRTEPCPETLVQCPLVALRDKTATTMKTRQQHFDADGGEIFVEVLAARLKLTIDSVETSCVVESIRNLAEQARISHEQRLSEIGLLATGVAHEIHNPLSAIQLALKAIQADFDAGETARVNAEYLDTVEVEIAKCMEVTDSLMMLSEPPELTRQLVRLDLVIPEVVSLLSYQAGQAGVSIVLDLEENLRTVIADSDIRMIVVNLAQNAFHAMPGGGTLTIAGRRKSGKIELIFSDTGIGIPHSYLVKIFLPFWTRRADASEGRGLGLSICKAIVDRSEGRISVESEVGVGSQFRIALPDADADRQAP